MANIDHFASRKRQRSSSEDLLDENLSQSSRDNKRRRTEGPLPIIGAFKNAFKTVMDYFFKKDGEKASKRSDLNLGRRNSDDDVR